ncbi:MAG: assimilatory sulfite reductase (NADPH) flavoprotein subunit [Verrucomicrobiales bacterium]|nr:assimilatory sulfite reductase (NADPH) flavoprotein subunit [Verrucomicrobiales bacterium]
MSFPNLTPLQPDQQQLAQQLGAAVNPDQATWLSGFFAGIGFAGNGGDINPAAGLAASVEKQSMTILYGSESGNAEKLAGDMKKAAEKANFKARIVNMADAKPVDLKKADNLLVIVSTWGEGDPPDSATSYYEAFMSDAMPQLPNLKYSVCALGDTSYEHFCKIGKDFDERLSKLGGERVYDRADCDVDYEETFKSWLSGALGAFPQAEAVAAVAATSTAPAALVYDKKNPYEAEILEKIVLNGTGSDKETLHVEISLEGSGLTYEPGDSLGVYPENRAADIDAILAATGLTANAKLGDTTLAEALKRDFDITTLSPAIAMKYNEIVGNKDLQEVLDEKDRVTFKEWIHGRQLIDLLETYPHKDWSAESFTGILRKLSPRLYSIASSLKKHENEVHLTVAAVRYDTHGRDRIGVCSCYLADDVAVGEKVRVFFHSNKNFRLPENNETPIIMVGPGTGIAPFRAFVEERSADSATGKNWLFFGDQHFSYDFLYQLEWLDYLEDGSLTELTTAFSRDQKEKIYVQHRLLERGAEIWQWLEEGACFYVCGDASKMAKDVHQALIDITVAHGGKSADEAKAYVDALRKEKRYQRDVY